MALDAKVPGALRGNYVAALAVSLISLGAGACGRRGGKPEAAHVVAPAEAVRPAFFAEALRKLGGAHYHATLRYSVGRPGGVPLAVTTTTDVWLDRTGNYRLREENDRDGGREVILTGRELAVALRYGKMIRRVAEEPEPSRMLEEGLGAPWAAFELAAPRMHVEKTSGRRPGRWRARRPATRSSLGDGAAVKPPAPALPLAGLRAWREQRDDRGAVRPAGRRRRHRRAAGSRFEVRRSRPEATPGPSRGRSRCTRRSPTWRRPRRSNGQRPRSCPCGSALCRRRTPCCAAWPSQSAADHPRHASGDHE